MPHSASVGEQGVWANWLAAMCVVLEPTTCGLFCHCRARVESLFVGACTSNRSGAFGTRLAHLPLLGRRKPVRSSSLPALRLDDDGLASATPPRSSRCLISGDACGLPARLGAPAALARRRPALLPVASDASFLARILHERRDVSKEPHGGFLALVNLILMFANGIHTVPPPGPALRAPLHRVCLRLAAGEQQIHFLRAGGHDGPELVPVDGFGDFAAGVAD